MDNEITLESEWLRNVKKISEKNASLKELEYFVNTACNSSQSYHNRRGQKLVILGNLFPEEIVRAMDIEYHYVYGGSYAMSLFQNVNLPKDIDDAAKSIVGFINSENLGLGKSDALLIPLCSDNMRKLGSLVSDIVTVIAYEVPADKENPLQVHRFISEINRVTKELEKHFHNKLSSKRLNKEFDISKKVSEAFNTFESLYRGKHTTLSASAFLLVANSYHLCKDINEWTMHLHRLNKELAENNNCTLSRYPDIILLSSPIYGPNYKLILLIEEMKLNVCAIIHPNIQHFKIAENMNCNSISVRELAIRYLESDITPVYLQNITKDKLIKNAINDDRVSGIIAPVIKGQINYECEIKHVEKLIENYKLPLIRIETMYDYHDYEQIRVRIEAFSEILNRLAE